MGLGYNGLGQLLSITQPQSRLSLENQTQHFLIITEKGDGYPVYRYDENTEDICSINCDLKDYMRCVIDFSSSKSDVRKWIGEMLATWCDTTES